LSRDGPGSVVLWHALAQANQSDGDLAAHRHFGAVQLLLGHMKVESKLRHLGVEVDDALAIADQTEV